MRTPLRVPSLPFPRARGTGRCPRSSARATRLGEHHERRAVGVRREPLEPVEPPRVAVGDAVASSAAEIGAAGPLGEHLRRLAGHLTGGEDRPHALLDVVGRELLGQSHDHVAARAQRAHHADFGLVEEIAPGRRHRRADRRRPAGPLPEGGREKLCRSASRRDASNVGGMTTRPTSRPQRSYCSSRGGLRSVSSARSATGPPIRAPTSLEMRPRRRQPAARRGAGHEELQRRIGRVPVAADGAAVALGGVTPRLVAVTERQLVDPLDQVPGHGPMLWRRLGGAYADGSDMRPVVGGRRWTSTT